MQSLAEINALENDLQQSQTSLTNYLARSNSQQSTHLLRPLHIIRWQNVCMQIYIQHVCIYRGHYHCCCLHSWPSVDIHLVRSCSKSHKQNMHGEDLSSHTVQGPKGLAEHWVKHVESVLAVQLL